MCISIGMVHVHASLTLETHGHVVSTVVTPLASSSSISSKEAPNAGRITTSPSATVSKRLPPTAFSSFSMNRASSTSLLNTSTAP